MHSSARDDLRPEESDLVGQWLDVGNRIEADAVCDRIEWLVRERLLPVASAAGGWETLYRDPWDGRLWEYTRPHGEWHAGGPPRLRMVAPGVAAAKYGLATG